MRWTAPAWWGALDDEPSDPVTPIEPCVWWDDGPEVVGVILGPDGAPIHHVTADRQPIGYVRSPR